MALAPKDFTPPEGELKKKLFPDYEDLSDAIQGWIDTALNDMAAEFNGQSNVPDNAVKHFVYWRAFRDVYIRMSADPESVSVDGSVDYRRSERQAERFRELADDHKDSLDSIRYPGQDESAVDHDDPPTSGSVGTSVSYG